MHPSYLAMYLNVAIAWLLVNLIRNKYINTHNFIIYSVLIVILFSIVIVLLSSKSGILTLFLMLVMFFSYLIFYKKKYIQGAIGIVCFILSIFFVSHFFHGTMERVKYALAAFSEENLKNNESIESTSLRIFIWRASNTVIKNNIIVGVGTGDSKEELMKEYERRNMGYVLSSKLNAHNEFYQVFISLGIIGFLLLVATLLVPMREAFKSSNLIYSSFLLIIVFNFFFESMLETQAGVMFYAFFNSLLCFSNRYSTINDTL